MRSALLAGLAVGAGLALAPAGATAPGISERVAALEAAPARCIVQAEAVAWRRIRLGDEIVRVIIDAPEANRRGRFWLALVHPTCMRR